MLASIHAPLIAMAPQGAISARQGTPERACARPQPAACGVDKAASEGSGHDAVRSTPLLVSRLESQVAGALAAFERDDQPTICERAPRRLPVGKRNRRAGAKQTSDDALHTSRTGLVLSESANVVRAVMGASAWRRLHMFPLCMRG